MIRSGRLCTFAFALWQISPASAFEAPGLLDRVVDTLARMSHVCLPLENPGESQRFSPAALESNFNKLQAAKRYCDAARSAYRLSLDLEVSDPTKSLFWGQQTVAVLLQAKAYDYVYEYGMRVLNDLNIPYTDDAAEPMRFLILQGMYAGAVELGSCYNPKWMQWSLGMAGGPNGEDTRPMQFLAFGQDYRNSKSFAADKNAVKNMAQKITDIYLMRVILNAKVDEDRRPYSPLSTFISINAAAAYKNELMEASPIFPKVNAKAIEYQAQLIEILRTGVLPENIPLDSVRLFFALPADRTYRARDLAVAVTNRLQAQFDYMLRQAAAAAKAARTQHGDEQVQARLLSARWNSAVADSHKILRDYNIKIELSRKSDL